MKKERGTRRRGGGEKRKKKTEREYSVESTDPFTEQ